MTEKRTKNPLDVVKGREPEIAPTLGIFIIVLLLLLGAIYFWGQQVKNNSAASQTAATIVIYKHIQLTKPAATTSASTGNARLDAIQNSLDQRTANVDDLNF